MLARRTTPQHFSYKSKAGWRTVFSNVVPEGIEQHGESTTFNPSVVGSNPTWLTPVYPMGLGLLGILRGPNSDPVKATCRHFAAIGSSVVCFAGAARAPISIAREKQILRRGVLAEPSGNAATVCKLDL